MPSSSIAPYIIAVKPLPSFLIRTELSFRGKGQHALGDNPYSSFTKEGLSFGKRTYA